MEVHRLYFVTILIFCQFISTLTVDKEVRMDCSNLRLGQYICPDPNLQHIDPKTQQFLGCTRQNKADGIVFKIIHIILMRYIEHK